jgi:hypothetical protein
MELPVLHLGLGKYIVDGGASLRFSPAILKKYLQLSSPDMILKDTQKYFYALDMASESFITSTDDSINLKRLKIAEAEKTIHLKISFQFLIMRIK